MNTVPKKLSKNDRLVLGVLAQEGRALGAYDILGKLRSQGLNAPAQVYRALNRLTAAGRAHRVESLNAFVACASAGDRHDHSQMSVFAICDECGAVIEFSAPSLGVTLSEWCSRRKFTPANSMIEVRGHCSACRHKAPSAAEKKVDR